MIWVAGEIPATAVVSAWDKLEFPQPFTVSVMVFLVLWVLVAEVDKTIGHPTAEESIGFLIRLKRFNTENAQSFATFVSCPCNICYGLQGFSLEGN